MSTASTIAILAAAYALLFTLERWKPLRRRKAPLAPRLFVNVAVSALAFLTAFVLVSPSSVASLRWTDRQAFGLIPMTGINGPAELVVTFLLLDLTFYYWHVANHRVAFLWRMHVVHHIDPDLDVTTAFRFHFVEVALSAGFRVVQILLVGPSLAAYAIYEAAFQLGTLFHHSNVRFPITLERCLNGVLVTPRMHGIHHSQEPQETNANFGVVFPWWDRLHRTLRLDVPQQRVAIGVPGYSAPGDNRAWHCVSSPFRRQRDYWPGREWRAVDGGPRLPRVARSRLAE